VFEALREVFETESDFVYQSIISGRRIAIIKLKKGIETRAGVLQYLELSDQKPDNSQRNSFDHIEIYPIALSYKELITRLESGGVSLVRVERPHHTTYDSKLGDYYSVKLTERALVDKIRNKEMS
jgi:predicted metalloenzyme YecM